MSGGKNVLCTTGSWKKHIAGLRERAAARSIPNAMPIFLNPRVCNTCHETRQDRLKDCACGAVSYCGKRCLKADKQHNDHHDHLLEIGQIPVYPMDGLHQLPHMRKVLKLQPAGKI